MSEVLQHVVVTLTAIASASFVARRVLTAVQPRGKHDPPCASCPGAGRPDPAADASAGEPRPLVLYTKESDHTTS